MPAIETKQLVYAYKEHLWSRPVPALRGLDLAVDEGEIYGFLGANGAGKTTTIKILVGLQPAKSGTATLFGQSVNDAASRRAIGFMPENPYFYEYLTAGESMRFYGALSEVPAGERRKRSDELLNFIGLADARDVRVKEFSKGMRQRLGIAQALIHRPRLVILDEPMSGLDPVGRLQVREAILSLKQQGLTVFFSSHVLGDVEMICDRVSLLRKGVLEAAGPIDELLQAESRRIEVGAEQLDRETSDKLRQQARQAFEQGGRTVFVFQEWEAANRAVEIIRASSGHLCLLRPVRETLEEYFMRTTGRSRAEVGDWSGGGDR